jgi:hypothetical protein
LVKHGASKMNGKKMHDMHFLFLFLGFDEALEIVGVA